MPRKKTDTTADALAAAQAALADAEAKQAANAEQLAEAQAREADVDRRAKDGDTTLTDDDFSQPAARVKRLTGYAEHHATQVEQARTELRYCQAEHLSVTLPQRLEADDFTGNAEKAADAIGHAVHALVDVINRRRQLVTELRDEARTHELFVGKVDPTSPVYVDSHGALVMDGTRRVPADVEANVAKHLRRVLEAEGLALTVEDAA